VAKNSLNPDFDKICFTAVWSKKIRNEQVKEREEAIRSFFAKKKIERNECNKNCRLIAISISVQCRPQLRIQFNFKVNNGDQFRLIVEGKRDGFVLIRVENR
jgi:hypothetical protein